MPSAITAAFMTCPLVKKGWLMLTVWTTLTAATCHAPKNSAAMRMRQEGSGKCLLPQRSAINASAAAALTPNVYG